MSHTGVKIQQWQEQKTLHCLFGQFGFKVKDSDILITSEYVCSQMILSK